MSSASIACPRHSAFGFPESTTNPPSSSMNVDQDYRASPGSPGLLCSGQAMLAGDTGGSRSNPRLPGEARPSWSTNPLHKNPNIYSIFAELPKDIINHILSYGTSIKVRGGEYVNQIHNLHLYHAKLNRIPYIHFAREHWWQDPIPLQNDLLYVVVYFNIRYPQCRLYKYYPLNNRNNEFVYFFFRPSPETSHMVFS